jgi:hypothetical protein
LGKQFSDSIRVHALQHDRNTANFWIPFASHLVEPGNRKSVSINRPVVPVGTGPSPDESGKVSLAHLCHLVNQLLPPRKLCQQLHKATGEPLGVSVDVAIDPTCLSSTVNKKTADIS